MLRLFSLHAHSFWLSEHVSPTPHNRSGALIQFIVNPMAFTSLPSLTTWWQSVQAHNTFHRLSARSSGSVYLPRRPFPPLAPAPSCASGSHGDGSRRHKQIKQAQKRANRQGACQAAHAAGDHISEVFNINSADTNQLQTALTRAIAAEDYTLASQVRDQLKTVVGGDTGTADWRQLGMPEWLADRVERMGFKYATGLPLQY